MHLTPRDFDKLLIYMLAEVALKRKEQGIKLNHPEAVAVISAAALDGARAGKTLEEVMTLASKVLTCDDVMDGVPEMIPRATRAMRLAAEYGFKTERRAGSGAGR
jgi:urease subunit gamma